MKTYSLTELWKNKGSIKSKRPTYFLKWIGSEFALECRSESGRYSKGTVGSKSAYIAYGKWVESTPSRRVYSERESGALSAIEQLLNIDLVRQFRVEEFRVDGYCKKTNTVFEIDEHHHFTSGVLNDECKKRQEKIELKLQCKFVRIRV